MQYGRRNTRIVKVRLKSDFVKAEADSSEVFTEYGSSASQVKAVKIMEIISGSPGCARQAAVAVSAYARDSTQLLTQLVWVWVRVAVRFWITSLVGLGWKIGIRDEDSENLTKRNKE